MTRIDIFDCEADRIKKLATHLKYESFFSDAFVMEAIFDLVDREASLYGMTAEELISKYIS